mmetsp:Transcript_64707/g.131572  ORF Transcript_64707/g.131572 Transcript_64707/m.131572 type:complete len:310 (-) Transcript_64707:517-1446(-)
MHLCHIGSYQPQNVFILQVAIVHQFHQEATSHTIQSITWPCHELIHHHATDKSRELAATNAEVVSNWRVAKDIVQVLPEFVNEEGEETITIIRIVCSFCSIAHTSKEPVVFLSREEVWDNAAGKHVVDKDQESFICDLSICHQECLGSSWLYHRFLVELLQVQLQSLHTIGLIHQNAQQVLRIDEGRQSGQGLLSRASHPNKQRMTTWVVGDAADTTHVPNGIIEKNQVHGCKGLVVFMQFVVYHFLECWHVFGRQVEALIPLSLRHKASHDQGQTEKIFLGNASKVLACHLLQDTLQLSLVRSTHQSV